MMENEQSDISRLWLPDDGDPLDYVPPASAPKPKAAKLPRSTKPFIRVYYSWLKHHELFPSHIRLLLVLLYRSREGRQSVRLTADIATEAGIEERHRSHCARKLERMGVVQIEPQGTDTQQLLVVRLKLAP
jgi:hypothetical protein